MAGNVFWVGMAFVMGTWLGSVLEGRGAVDAKTSDLGGIKALHQRDIAATLSGSPDALAELWTDDAVRLNPGAPAEVGKEIIHKNDIEQKAQNPNAKILSYVPHIEDVAVINGWAVEWGNFEGSFRTSENGQPQVLRGKLLRVLRRQNDGTWRFARVMWNETAEK